MSNKDFLKEEIDNIDNSGDQQNSLDNMLASSVLDGNSPDNMSSLDEEQAADTDSSKNTDGMTNIPDNNDVKHSSDKNGSQSENLSSDNEVSNNTQKDEEIEQTDSNPTDEISETPKDMIDDLKENSKEEKKKTLVIPPKQYKGKWYIVHTYSGHENKVAKTLMQRVQAMGFEDRIFDALVPTRDTIRVRGGKKETVKEKIFPGYILVNMDLSDEAWILVRTTPGVTSFVGVQNKPTPIRDDEVQAIVAFVGQKDPVYKAQFTIGEAVKITDGPFSDFLGTVESIDEGKGKVKVLVSIFGRETPVELDFLQVAKI